MIDARNTFNKVSSTINDFSDEHLEGLTAIINAFRSNDVTLSAVEGSHNEWLKNHFPENKYQDVEGLCKIASLDEIKEQDYSLTPGRYVGVKIDIDMDFDYKTRMTEIHTELAQLNTEANSLMEQIQSVKL
jgi:type I restriction enzyme M protein